MNLIDARFFLYRYRVQCDRGFTRLTGTTIFHVNALHWDISGGRDNFHCNAHDQYSQMEANMAEIADAKCEHAQYARRNPFNLCRTAAKRENIEKTDKTKFLLNTIL